MNDTQRTRIPRAALAIKGARDARRRIATRAQFVRVVAAQLDTIAPGTVRVRTVPVTRDGRIRTWVVLDDADGRPIEADLAAHRAAYGLLQRAFPAADWSRARTYDARTGALALDEPTAPAALALDTTPETRP
ncbi:hypothetical protein [Streptomyces sp. enrichment culture]|uniref:hypothetical protein n=1 Tax=Streptomyces sp. enrichment culture TaxID=1795815 RepID=UPI003F55EFF5